MDQSNNLEGTLPPTTRELVPDVVESRWPKVIGTLSIVLASIGLLGYACGSLNAVLGPMFANMAPPDMRPPPVPTILLVIQTAQSCIAWLLSLWLLFAGISLLKRKRSGRSRHISWAFAKIAVSAISTLIGVLMMDQNVKNVNDQFSKSKIGFTMTNQLMMILMVGMLALFLIYPVFLILWLGRKKIVADVESWR